jgi:uncharacterized damage-inducible protein DinB
MKRITLAILLLSLSLQIRAQDPPPPKTPPTLRSILLDQLRTTHTKEDWFVPVNIAVEGLTAEQAKWTPGPGNHSVGQLANHLLFWNSEALARFKGEKPPKFSGNNDETFNNFDAAQWANIVQQLDKILAEWEKAIETADDKKLELWAPTIARIGTHNAYHTGQIIYVRKLQGVWDPAKGVK